MSACEQTQGQSIYQHGLSVNEYLVDLISLLKTGTSSKIWRIPDWLFQHKDSLLARLPSDHILSQYAIFHDAGKPYCLEIDAEGRRHFPNHAQKSHDIWIELGGDPQIARLILHDMDIHTIKADDLPAFAKMSEAPALLLTGLAEIHSNAIMFDKEKGIESTSFKIKWKQIDKRGRQICKLILGDKNENIDSRKTMA